MDTNNALDAFTALSQETRLDIFRRLIKSGEDGLSAGTISDAVGGRQNTVSSHLAILSRAGLIAAERDGRSIIYRARYDTVRTLVAFILEDCCNGAPEVCSPLIKNLACLQPASEACCD